MSYKKINIDQEIIKDEFNCYSIEDRQEAIIAILKLFKNSNNKKKVLIGLEEFNSFINKEIKALKDKAIEKNKAYYKFGKKFYDYKKGIKETILKNHPEYFRKNKRKYFTWK